MKKTEEKEKKPLHAGHRERIRNRFINDNGENFEPHELLEILLFYTITRANTNETAHLLIQKFGSVSEIFEKGSYEAFLSVPGIGEKSAVFLCVVSALFKLYQPPKNKPEYLRKSAEYRKFFLKHLKQEAVQEVLMAVCLSDTGQVMHHEKLECGTAGKVRVNMQKLVRCVMKADCTQVILGHNHPNGEAKPSFEDIIETRRIIEIFTSLDIQLLDHIIIADGKAYSMAEHKDF